MAKRLQHRGGTTSQHSTFTGAVREVTVDTDKNTLVVHDGATAGGHPLATATNFTSTGIDDNATSTAITINSSEKVGIGVVPSTSWTPSVDALQIGTSGAVWSGDTADYLYLSSNSVFDGTNFRYINSNVASHYVQTTNGFHQFYNAPTGTAGNSFSPLKRLQISNDGDISFYEDTGTTPKFFWDASTERLELGTSSGMSPTATLVVNEASDGTPAIEVVPTTDNTNGVSANIRLWGSAYGITNRYSEIKNITDGSTASNELAFDTNGTERMRIDSSGNLGINETAPLGKVHIKNGDTGASSVSGDKDELVIENNTHSGITTLAGDSYESGMFFGHTSDARAGEIYTHYTNQLMTIGTRMSGGQIKFISDNASERMRIDSSGNVGINTTSPTGQLQIYNASGTGGIRLTRLDNITDINMHLQTNSTSTLLNFYGDAVFRTNVKGDGTNAIERMRIDSSGDVLVATTTNGSKAKLHAEGSMGIGAERFDTHEIGKGASGTYTTITTTFTATSGAGSVIVEALMTGYSGVYLDHVIGKYSTQANVVMRNNGSGGTTVTLTESSSVYTHTITTSVLHPVVKYKITVGGLAFFTVAPTITFA